MCREKVVRRLGRCGGAGRGDGKKTAVQTGDKNRGGGSGHSLFLRVQVRQEGDTTFEMVDYADPRSSPSRHDVVVWMERPRFECQLLNSLLAVIAFVSLVNR